MKNFNNLISSQLSRNIESYDKLSSYVYDLLHLNKEKHNVWVVVKQQQLTLLTDNPYLGTQLQYEQKNICTAINRYFLLELKKTKVKIVPPSTSITQKHNKLYQIGSTASKSLASIADLIEDPELRESLNKIATKTDS
jgi:hypothetical protein